MARMAAVKYDFKCGICGKALDATWETDHIIPLSRARSAADFERLNSLDNLQPVHRIPCHQQVDRGDSWYDRNVQRSTKRGAYI